jgi:hypothetical protein
MYEEPMISAKISDLTCTTWPSFDCNSCFACFICLATPAPDIDVMVIQHLWEAT